LRDRAAAEAAGECYPATLAAIILLLTATCQDSAT
jgi:hypothetical protein